MKDLVTRSSWINWVGTKFSDRCQWSKRRRNTQRKSPDTEIKVMMLQVMEYLEPPEAGRGQKALSYNAFRGSPTLLMLGFELLVSRTVRESISVNSVNYQICGNL